MVSETGVRERLLVGCWVVAALAALATPTFADQRPQLVGGRSWADHGERAFTLTYTLEATAGEITIELLSDLLPANVAVTGARISGPGFRQQLGRMQTEVARELADAVRGGLDGSESDRAPTRGFVLIEHAPVGLQIELGVPASNLARQRFTIEIEGRIPTCRHGGRRWVVVTAELLDVFRAPGAIVGSEVPQCSGSQGEWVGYLDPVAPRAITATVERLGRGDGQLARVDIAMPRELAPMPVDPSIVVLVDGSRSVEHDQWISQTTLVDRYLQALPRAHVAVVAYARTPTLWTTGSPTDAFVTSTSARRQMLGPIAQWRRRNGSNVSEALEFAARLLAHRRGDRRVLLISDQLLPTRERALAPKLADRLPGITLVAVNANNGLELERDDDGPFAAAAAASGGMAWLRGWSNALQPLDPEPLIRPTTLDRLQVTGSGWQALERIDGLGDCGGRDRLLASASCWWWGVGTKGAHPALTVEGLMWNRKWTKTVELPQPDSPVLARAFGRFDDPKVGALAAELAASVNDHWSLYAEWGRHGGSYGGGGTGWGTICGCGRHGTIGHGSGTGSAFDVRTPIVVAISHCRAPGVDLEVTVETTAREVVAVAVRATGHGRAAGVSADTAAACAERAIWDIGYDFPGSEARTFIVHD